MKASVIVVDSEVGVTVLVVDGEVVACLGEVGVTTCSRYQVSMAITEPTIING